MKKWIAIVALFFIGFVAKAQYGNPYSGPDRYFYDEEFDWRWDIRVRISDGYNSGFLTRRESNRLYRHLEDIERKEWAFQSDGHYSVWEQDEIWLDVVDLNRRIGLDLTDWDRRYYGYSGVVISGRLPWYFGSTYDFHRFDRRGYGTIHVGYSPRKYYPVKHVYYTHNNNYTSHWNNARVNRTATSSRVTEPRRAESGRTSNMRNTESSRVSTPRTNENGRVRTSTSEPSRSGSSVQRESSRVPAGSSMNSSRSESGSRDAGNVSRSNSSSTTRESSRVSTPAPARSSGSVDRSSSRTGSSVDRSSSSRSSNTESNTSSSRSASTSNGRGRN